MKTTVITVIVHGDKDTAAETANRIWGVLPRSDVADSDVSIDRRVVRQRAQELWAETNYDGRW